MKKSMIFKLIVTFFSLLFLPVWAFDVPKPAAELYNLGIDYYGAGNVEKSIESFNKAIAIYPRFYEAYYNLGQIQAANGKLDDAIKTYTALIDLKPTDNESIYELGKLLYKRGYLKKSLSYLDRVSPESLHYNEVQQLTDKILARQKELEDIASKKAAEQKALAEKKVTEERDALEKKAAQISEQNAKSTIYSGIPTPSGVISDSQGNVYVASYGENTVYKINKNNQKSVFVTNAALGGPLGLAIDTNDNLYIANYTKGNILKVAPNGATTVFLTIQKPYCISVSAQTLYVTEQDTNTVIKFPL